MYLLKIGFSQTVMNADKILQAYVGRTQISRIKILAPWAKGQMVVKMVGVFCNGYNELAFLCNGTDRQMKFGQKRQ